MKAKDRIGLYLLVALLGYVGIAIFIYLEKPVDTKFQALSYLACSGGLGGTIYCIKGLYVKIAEDNFDPKWGWWYIFRPIMLSLIHI